MAKVYRMIPDTVTSAYSKGYLSDVTEDLFYKLGYLNFNDHEKQYFSVKENNSLNCYGDSTDKGIFFFTSAWSCCRALIFLNSVYGNEVARVMEYEIPDGIVAFSKQAVTNHQNFQASGIIVPLDLLTSDWQASTEFTEVLRIKLETIGLKDVLESFKSLESIYKGQFSRSEGIKCFFPFVWEDVNSKRFSNVGVYGKSHIITGRSFIINRKDLELLIDVIYRKKSKDDLNELCEKSNGVLELDDFLNYLENDWGRTRLKPEKN